MIKKKERKENRDSVMGAVEKHDRVGYIGLCGAEICLRDGEGERNMLWVMDLSVPFLMFKTWKVLRCVRDFPSVLIYYWLWE